MYLGGSRKHASRQAPPPATTCYFVAKRAKEWIRLVPDSFQNERMSPHIGNLLRVNRLKGREVLLSRQTPPVAEKAQDQPPLNTLRSIFAHDHA